MKYFGLIPAKGQSRGLYRKNLTNLIDRPLVVWTIDAGLKANRLSEVFVSTEDDQIAKISLDSGAKVFKRPEALCEDSTTTDEVILHAIPCIREITEEANFGIVLLQPTSPLRTSVDIDKAIEVFVGAEINALVSVYPVDSSWLKAYKVDQEGYMTPAFSSDAPYVPRQSLPKIFMPNGALYIFTAEKFLEYGTIPRTKLASFIMDEERSIDIDSQEDLDKALHYLEKIDAKMA